MMAGSKSHQVASTKYSLPTDANAILANRTLQNDDGIPSWSLCKTRDTHFISWTISKDTNPCSSVIVQIFTGQNQFALLRVVSSKLDQNNLITS
jgi:hypothetical protein